MAPPIVYQAPSPGCTSLASLVMMVAGATLRVAVPLAPSASVIRPYEKRATPTPARSTIHISSNRNWDVHTQKAIFWVDDSSLCDSYITRELSKMGTTSLGHGGATVSPHGGDRCWSLSSIDQGKSFLLLLPLFVMQCIPD